MDKDQLVERYIQGRMTTSERREFEAMLKEDDNLAREAAFLTNLKRVIEAEEEDRTRQMVTTFEAEARKNTTPKRLIPYKWLVAASTLLIASLSFLFLYDPALSPEQIYAEHFTPYPNEVVAIVRGAGPEDKQVAAFAAYQNEDYQNAVLLFEHLKTQGTEPAILFYQANALIRLGRAEEALPLLQDHLASGGPLSDKAPWYLAMAYLQLNDTPNAKKWLQQVAGQKGYKATEAATILESLD